MKSKLDEILELKTEEIMKRSFDELLKLVNNVECFVADRNKQSYSFEVHVYKFNNSLKVMVECSRNIFFLRMFGKQKYFSIDDGGRTQNISGEEFNK